ncbi:MAG TPA: hypothetical protein VHB47_01460, partial [Thermoanaerobaculia bacterium]|nr:hypothetical protein [Thermoanaerobaculia bacterium]
MTVLVGMGLVAVGAVGLEPRLDVGVEHPPPGAAVACRTPPRDCRGPPQGRGTGDPQHLLDHRQHQRRSRQLPPARLGEHRPQRLGARPARGEMAVERRGAERQQRVGVPQVEAFRELVDDIAAARDRQMALRMVGEEPVDGAHAGGAAMSRRTSLAAATLLAALGSQTAIFPAGFQPAIQLVPSPAPGAGFRFGSALAVGDGVVAVGAYLATVNGAAESGAVYLFRNDGAGN